MRWFSRFGVAVPMRDTVVERQAYSWTEGPEQVFRPALDGGGISRREPKPDIVRTMREIPRRSARAVLAVSVGAVLVAAAGNAAAQSPRRRASSSRSGSGAASTCSTRTWSWASRTTRETHDDTADTAAHQPAERAAVPAPRRACCRTRCSRSRPRASGSRPRPATRAPSAFIIGARGSLVYNIMPGRDRGREVRAVRARGRRLLQRRLVERRHEHRRGRLQRDQEGHRLRVPRRRRREVLLHRRRQPAARRPRARRPQHESSKSYSPDCEFMLGLGFTFGGHAAAPPPPPPP